MQQYIIGEQKDVQLINIIECKSQLDRAKDCLQEQVDNKGIKIWEQVTRWYELSPFVIKECRGRWSIPMNASNAFFKAIELFKLICLKPDDRLFDNASLPGDFIRASKWYTENENLDWRANSLIGGLDDRYHLMRHHPERWMMNTTMNGDVCIQSNREIIADRLDKWQPTIYTSDLGFGPQDYYQEETEHYTAHLGQTLLGLRILAKHGIMILKTFNLFEYKSRTIVIALSKVFVQVRIVKPEMSKADNSECYIVCFDYLVPDCNLQQLMIEVKEGDDMCNEIKLYSSRLTEYQVNKIYQNISMFQRHQRGNYTRQKENWITNNILYQ
jgi:23S rRNA U2552 (ribose-2'-O)-methylase RlmE/FtsJ